MTVVQARDEKGRFTKAQHTAVLYCTDDVAVDFSDTGLITIHSLHRNFLWDFRRLLHIGLILVVALNLFDLASTLTALQMGAHEANPVARLLLGVSPLALVALKAGVVFALWGGLKKAAIHKALPACWLVVGMYAMVALNNAVVVWRLAHQ